MQDHFQLMSLYHSDNLPWEIIINDINKILYLILMIDLNYACKGSNYFDSL